MAIIRWDPFRDLMTLRDKMNRLFEDAASSRGEEKDLMSSSWTPAVDIYENEEEVVLTAELPGVEENDIEIKIEDNVLTLKGERKFEKDMTEENYHRIERAYGSFYRSFRMPQYIDQDKIKADHDQGILKVQMPKNHESKSRKVKIIKAEKTEKK
jgi:HSP20 family protein